MNKQHKENLKIKQVIPIDVEGNIYFTVDYTRWNELKWYKKIFGFISKKYKSKFIDKKGFDVSFKHHYNEHI
jgi:hypothetical protein